MQYVLGGRNEQSGGLKHQRSKMEWWINAALSLIFFVLLGVMYFISVRESRALSNYALLILLDHDVHATQRASLKDLILASDAKNAFQLGKKTRTAITDVAMRLSKTTLDVNGIVRKHKA
jgi:hypothetical protein